MSVRIQLRRDSDSNWETNNPVLGLAEIGLDITSGNFKIGNGVDQWTQLNYFSVAVDDVISQAQLDAAIAEIGGDGLTFDAQTGLYSLDLSAVSQDIIPDVDVLRDLGSSSKRWKDLYLSGDTIFLGNIQLKDAGEGKFEVLSGDGQTTLETVLLPGQVTDTELSEDSTDIKARFVTHRDATDNPHSVTATQVGLGNVTDESKATMFTNPAFTGTVSGVTASHVGLGSVENYGIATKEEAEVGSATNKYMTPERTKEAILELSPPTDLTGIEGRLDTIEGNDQTAGSIAKSLFDAKAYTDTEIDAAKLALGTNFSVANIAARDALEDLTVGDIVFVADNGDGKFAQYKVTVASPNKAFIKIMDEDILLNALSAANIKSAYEGNADTNAFTDALQTKLNGIEENAKDDQSASEVSYIDTSQTYSLGNNVQDAIYAVDDELIALDGRVDTLETDLSTHTSDSTIHFTQSQISITESQISNLGNYEVADATILKSADIGVSVQGFDANTVVDANYETFDSDGTFANLRAQATTAEDVELGNVTNESKATMFTDAALTGVPIAPTAASSTNTTQIATTAFVLSEIAVIDGGEFN